MKPVKYLPPKRMRKKPGFIRGNPLPPTRADRNKKKYYRPTSERGWKQET